MQGAIQPWPATAESRTSLWTDTATAERRLTLGKIQNLRLSVRLLHGVIIPAHETFSFWRQIGRLTSRKGYKLGRELREGCLIPAIGGGICQLSNALYAAALQAGCEVIERHAHTQVIPGSLAELGRDATVAWNDVDLQFRSPCAIQIEAFLTEAELVVRFHSESKVHVNSSRISLRVVGEAIGSCVSCGEQNCHHHAPHLATTSDPATAYIVDAVCAEWLELWNANPGLVLSPMNGKLWKVPRYAWPNTTRTALIQTLTRTLRARFLEGQSPSIVRTAQLREDRRVALALARHLRYDQTDLIVSQTLLPALWQSGALGGRRFSVLMSRMPFDLLQQQLDLAFKDFPDQLTLNDFRAPVDWVASERDGLNAAHSIISPHVGIAALFPEKSTFINWSQPPKVIKSRIPEPLVVFPGPTASRKGALAVREAVRSLQLPLVCLSVQLEGSNFWQGINYVSSENWLSRAAVVVQPSIVEDSPRVLLQALAMGIPIIATEMCGLREGDYIAVKFGDVEALTLAIASVIQSYNFTTDDAVSETCFDRLPVETS